MASGMPLPFRTTQHTPEPVTCGAVPGGRASLTGCARRCGSLGPWLLPPDSGRTEHVGVVLRHVDVVLAGPLMLLLDDLRVLVEGQGSVESDGLTDGGISKTGLSELRKQSRNALALHQTFHPHREGPLLQHRDGQPARPSHTACDQENRQCVHSRIHESGLIPLPQPSRDQRRNRVGSLHDKTVRRPRVADLGTDTFVPIVPVADRLPVQVLGTPRSLADLGWTNHDQRVTVNLLGGHYRGLELPILILAFLITLAGVVMLVFTGPKGLGWVLLPVGMLSSLPVSYRAKKRADEASRRGPV